MTRVTITHQAELRVHEWEARHAEGEVPGRWPYGLDLMARPGIEVTWREVRALTRRQRALAYLNEMLPPNLPTSALSDDVILTWDESQAVRIIGSRRGKAHYSGVIWATDRDLKSSGSRLLTCLRRATGLWVLSRGQIDALREQLGPNGPPVSFVRFGIDTDFYAPAPYPDRPLVVSAGGDRDRDIETLFAALELVHRAVPEADILVQSRTSAPPPSGVKVFTSLPHTKLRDLYRKMSVMVVATRPNLHVSGMTVALEAQATSRPCVITDSPGMQDYVDPGGHGLAVGRTPAAIAEAVVALLRDPSRAEALGLLGLARVRTAHTQQSMSDQFVRLVTTGGTESP